MPATGRSPGLRAMQNASPEQLLAPLRSGLESGCLAYRWEGSAGMGSKIRTSFPVHPARRHSSGRTPEAFEVQQGTDRTAYCVAINTATTPSARVVAALLHRSSGVNNSS